MKRMNSSPTLFLLAQEKSADLLGQRLMRALKECFPSPYFTGIGGEGMQKEGLQSLVPIHQFEIMGFSALFGASFRLFKNFRKVRNEILAKNPDMVISIDYPEFNMLLAKSLRKKGYKGKLVHYVIPSVWAWRANRIKSLEKNFDLLLSILPFEKELFKKESLVTYVGHPICQEVVSYRYDAHWRTKLQIAPNREIIAIFPGSRTHEIKENLSLQLKTAKELIAAQRQAAIVISVANGHHRELICQIAKKELSESPILVPSCYRYELMREAKIALATCGTVILELALHQTPTAVTYKLSWINYLLGRYLFRIHLRLPFFSLPNLILKRELFPEVIGRKLTLEEIQQALDRLYKQKLEEPCRTLRELLLQESDHLSTSAILATLRKE